MEEGKDYGAKKKGEGWGESNPPSYAQGLLNVSLVNKARIRVLLPLTFLAFLVDNYLLGS